jgi:hypothetical protein
MSDEAASAITDMQKEAEKTEEFAQIKALTARKKQAEQYAGLLLSIYGAIQVYQCEHRGKRPDKVFMNEAALREVDSRIFVWQVADVLQNGEIITIFGVPVQRYYDGGEEPDFYIAERVSIFSNGSKRTYLQAGSPPSENINVLTVELKEIDDGK